MGVVAHGHPLSAQNFQNDRNLLPRIRDLVLRRSNHIFSGEAVLLLQFLQRRRGAERFHTDAVTVPTDVPRPAESRSLFYGQARADRLRRHLLAIFGVIATVVLENLP